MKNINNLRIGQEILYGGVRFNVMSIIHPSPQPKSELDMKWLVELECGFVPFDDVEVFEFNRQDI